MRLIGWVLMLAGAGWAQRLDPVQWKGVAGRGGGAGEVVIRLDAEIQAGWHLYSLTTPKPSIPTTFKFPDEAGFELVEVLQKRPALKVDPNGNQAEQFEERAEFYVRARAKDAAAKSGAIQVRYGACDDKQCLPPKRKMIEFAVGEAAIAVPVSGFTSGAARVTIPVIATPAPPSPLSDKALGQFLLVAFGLGLAAVFTPCVFPMIPFTMSYFLEQPAAGRLGRAILFCAGIVVLFTGMGIGITALMGASGAVQIGSNPWVNTAIAGIFVALGLSLLGAFEITLPSGLLTKLNAASSGGGALGTVLMGLTFALTSFACVGPFVGTLLAASVQGDKLQPALGMASFASGLATPFFFLALFPAFLQRMPRSGVWLMRVKIVFGFVVLALALKYLANVDVVLQWNVLSRERFLAVWFVLFAMPGLYLLGLLRMEGIKAEEAVTIPRLLVGVAFLAFSLSLLPGMFGARLGEELEAYVPFAKSGGVLGGGGATADAGLPWMKNDLAGALAKAKAENKRVFVNFTGYACTNCHWMKANMFTRAEVASLMKEFVLVELYTDGTDAESEKNQKLQETRFQTVAIPYYVILSSEDQVAASFPGLTKKAEEWVAFLKKGLGS